MTQIVQPDSLVTLHYRISLDNGQSLISTFETTPATMHLGRGDLLPTLERCLAGTAVLANVLSAKPVSLSAEGSTWLPFW